MFYSPLSGRLGFENQTRSEIGTAARTSSRNRAGNGARNKTKDKSEARTRAKIKPHDKQRAIQYVPSPFTTIFIRGRKLSSERIRFAGKSVIGRLTPLTGCCSGACLVIRDIPGFEDKRVTFTGNRAFCILATYAKPNDFRCFYATYIQRCGMELYITFASIIRTLKV